MPKIYKAESRFGNVPYILIDTSSCSERDMRYGYIFLNMLIQPYHLKMIIQKRISVQATDG